MAYTKPTVSDFKTFFNRDFPYGATDVDVMDTDISKAYMFADFNFNEGLFGSQEQFNLGYLLLSAHWLVMNLRSSSQGLAGKYSWLQNSRSVGSVSEGVSIPQHILDNPVLSQLSQTNYGAQYLELLLPLMVGQVFSVYGGTRA